MILQPTLTTEQRLNLSSLACYLEGLPPDYQHFEMSTYAELQTPEETSYALGQLDLTQCGSVACAVGHGPAAGILFNQSEIEGTGDYRKVSWDLYVRRFVPSDMSPEYEWVFSGGWSSADNHHYGAAARIRFMLAEGVPVGEVMDGLQGDDDTEVEEAAHEELLSIYSDYDKRYVNIEPCLMAAATMGVAFL